MSEKLSSLVFPQQCDSDQDLIKTRAGWQAERGRKIQQFTFQPNCNSGFVISDFLEIDLCIFNGKLSTQLTSIYVIWTQAVCGNKKWWLFRVNSVDLCKRSDKAVQLNSAHFDEVNLTTLARSMEGTQEKNAGLFGNFSQMFPNNRVFFFPSAYLSSIYLKHQLQHHTI